MAEILKGKPVADEMDVLTQEFVQMCGRKGIIPKLSILRVGAREEDLAYERSVIKRCEKDGIAVCVTELPVDAGDSKLFREIDRINEDSSIHGVLMFRPLPKGYDEKAACARLLPEKDMDGITMGSMAGIYSGNGTGYAPCTAEAVIRVLSHYKVPMSGAKAAVVGRSLVIGRPVALLLMQENATVTICHTKTKDLAAELKTADIVVAAAGKAEMIKGDMLTDNQVVIDVGINWSDEKGKIVGDVDYESAEAVCGAITPVPGGVGGVTTAVMARHVAEAACKTMGLK